MMNSIWLLILMIDLDDLGRYSVGEGWKVIKMVHFGTHYYEIFLAIDW
jgi:hypothetical protein